MSEAWSAGWRPFALLAVLCLGLYLPGIAALPPLDRDEARFAQATRQMLVTGDFLRARFQDEARNKKPIGIYWLQAASVAVLSKADSTAIWPYRLPSLLGATAAVLLAFAFGRVLLGDEAALIGAALLAGTLSLVAEAHLAKTDAALLATVVMAQGALGALYREERFHAGSSRRRWVLLFWLAQGAGILIKGPITPLVSLLTAGTLSIADREARWLRALRPLWGVPLMLVIAAPWFIAISVATGGAYLGDAVGHDFMGKLFGAQEAHGAPPGYYLALLAITFWPASLLLGPTFAWAWRDRAASSTRFLIAWAVPFWIVLELVPTKLPHYILPAYPALALLAGRAVIAARDGALRRYRWLDVITVALWSVVTIGLAAAMIVLPLWYAPGLSIAGIVAALVLLLLGGSLAASASWHRETALAARLTVLALLTFALVFQFVAPALDRLWLSREAARIVATYRPPADAPVVAVGYSEPSLVFWLGTRTRSLSAEQAARYVTSARGAAALVSSDDDAAFRGALKALGWEARRIDLVTGLDYSNGRQTTLTLYAGAPG